MSAPSDSNAAAKPKPKRPLSGYNLFYRYKRNKILEATSRPTHDNEAVIRAVLAAPSGLEGVSPASSLFCLPPAKLDQFRSAAIRYAMEGKLFPNENTRNRRHCKVHGMGFVEMSTMMRQMWGQADKLAKDVFNELADVGRVRYRRLVAEYKLSSDHPTNVHLKRTSVKEPVESSVVEKTAQTQTSNKSGEAEAAAKSTATRAAAAAPVKPAKKEAITNLPATDANTKTTAKAAKPPPILNDTQPASDHMLEALFGLERKDPPPAAAATAAQSAEPKPTKKEGSRPSYGRRVSTDLNFQGPVPCRAQPLSFDTMINHNARVNVPADTKKRPSYGRRVSTAFDLCGDSLFEPLSVETADSSAAPRISNQPKWGRRVSTDCCPLPPTQDSMGGAVTDNSTANSSPNTDLEDSTTNLVLQQMMLKKALKKIQCQIAQNNKVLPPEMQLNPIYNVSGEKAYLNIMASSGPSSTDRTVVGSNHPGIGKGPEEEGVSARDFMDFIGDLDDAIDDHGIDVAAGAIEATECTAESPTDDNLDGIRDGCLTYIFGKPMFSMPRGAFGGKPASPSQSSIPMPAGVELKTNRARMA